VHGGHLNADDDPAIGVDNWRKTFARQADEGGFPLPVLIENTAGGTNAVARRFERLAQLWDAIGEYGVGFCLDTCHAHAGGEDLSGIVDRVLSITGRIDLVHANDSRDAFDSGADRHANFGTGQIDASVIADVCRAAGSDVIVETPGGPDGQGADIAYLRKSI
jgi:deoxyribonuclease-4